MYLSVSICKNFHFPSLLGTESELGLPKHLLLADMICLVISAPPRLIWFCKTQHCSVAFQLVVQCNVRNVDILEINQSMCHGYRNGRTPHEGCRVYNWVLLALLVDIAD